MVPHAGTPAETLKMAIRFWSSCLTLWLEAWETWEVIAFLGLRSLERALTGRETWKKDWKLIPQDDIIEGCGSRRSASYYKITFMRSGNIRPDGLVLNIQYTCIRTNASTPHERNLCRMPSPLTASCSIILYERFIQKSCIVNSCLFAIEWYMK